MNVFIHLLIIIFNLCPAYSMAKEVVIYTSVDQVFSEPILKAYEKTTGVKVKAVYDVEAAKTTGMVNRLIAEKRRPKCDVFWNSEFAQTIVLKKKGVLTPYCSPNANEIPSLFKDSDCFWTGFAARARVLIYNTKLLKKTDLPDSILELTQSKWHSKVGLAYPLFGTTATHMTALNIFLGQKQTESFLKKLKSNDVHIVDGNGVVRDLVVEGRLPIGFTDTDDANVAIQAGKPVKRIYPDQNGMGTLLIPNTVALINNGPHPEAGKKLIDYLLSKHVESRLAYCESAQMPLRKDVKKPGYIPDFSSIKAMNISYEKIADHMKKTAKFCQNLFIR